MGFFTKSELEKEAKIEVPVDQLEPNCMHCGLNKNCQSPKMSISGEGNKKILIISESPTHEEDEYGVPLIGDTGKLLSDNLREIGISLNKDCWKINAVNCAIQEYRLPTQKEIKYCFPYVEKAIRELKPKVILLLGTVAINSLMGDHFSDRSVNRWRGYQIPDERFGCFIIPMIHPSQVIRNENDKNLKCVFERDIKRIKSCLKREYTEQINYEKYVTVLKDFESVKRLLNRIIQRKTKIMFDYETTGLKPYRSGHKIVTIGLAVSSTKAFAFPYEYKSFWTEEEFKEIKILWKEILLNKDIKKMAHNYKFEDAWSRVRAGGRPKGWYWDPMMAEHCIDNRSKSTGLKFQTYVNYGVLPYDKHIAPFLKSKNGEFNTVEKAPFKELLIYNGLDCIYAWMRYEEQKHKFNGMKGLSRAYGFFMKGLYTMGTIQHNGICADMSYYKNTKQELTTRIFDLEKYLTSGRESKKFKEKFGRDIKITSNQDLGKLFYEVLGKSPIYTDASQKNYKTDKLTLESLNLPFVDKLEEMKRLEKAKGTYLGQFAREVVNGKMHPLFDLHIPVSYRSCIAGYEKVMVMRDFESNPEGVPIKDIKIGDMVYCFDDDLNPAIRKVLWQGKTGHRKLVRVHYYRKGKKGHFDCTPEHKIRLINGDYVEAQHLLKEQYYKRKTSRSGNCRTLACSRYKDRLSFTGHINKNTGILEHRFIYENIIGNLNDNEIVHHIDRNHYNHEPSNLKKMSLSDHSLLHVKDTICSKQSRRNNKIAVEKAWKNGNYDHTIKRGTDNPRYVEYTKEQCLKMLHSSCGMPKKAADKHKIDFGIFKRSINTHNIDWKSIKLQYDKNGKFISKDRLLKLSKLGRKEVKSILGHNHYKLIKLYDLYKIDTKRKWGNQYGEFKPGNHLITKVEWLNRKEDVYDIEVEDFHNFFVNEICVHNSSSMPNFQNLPKRDPEIGSLIRKGIVPSPGNVLCEADFSGAEVITSCCFHKDPNFKKYLIDPSTDMHRDVASDLWMLPEGMLNNSSYNDEQKKLAKMIRFFAKNNWTFAQFYGDWFGSCGPNLWENVIHAGLKLPSGITVKEHLENMGIYELGEITKQGPTPGSFLEHCKEVEHKMWNERFPVYTQWKKDIVDFYQKYGYIETFFGFRFVGYMDRKQCANFPIQGTSFHLLVFTLIEVAKFIRKNKLQTKLIGQIHDSIFSDVPKDEIQFYLSGVNKIVKNLYDRFDWLVVPMEIEAEISRTREEGGNFAEMKEVDPENVKLW